MLAAQSAHHAADEAAGAATAAAATVMTATAATATAAAVVMTRRMIVRGIVIAGGRLGRDDFGEQRLVLQRIEVAALGIAAGGLPARDHGAGGFIELARDLGVEAEAVQPALHVAALALVETDLVFGDLVGIRVKGRGIDAGQIAGLRIVARGRVTQRGDPG